MLSVEPRRSDESADILRRIAGAIAHRGPDDEGVWVDADAGIGLCHRRLSIIDLSPLGHQPMTSNSGRYVITFNGEIYNYTELRAALTMAGQKFRGASDTEVLLGAVEQWGLHEALVRSSGMFALGLWDRKDRVLHLARDRFGEKPLYFGEFGGWLLFGSELKALRQHPVWVEEIDRNALTLLLRHGFIPAPHSIYKRVKKILPGQIISATIVNRKFDTRTSHYWSTKLRVEAARHQARQWTDTTAIEAVDGALQRAVGRQMVADVPVGAFLSGGVDSSLIVSLMQRQATQPVRTFSIGFSEAEFNEAPFAKAVADHLGTIHTELIVSPQDVLAVIPNLPVIYDEPFADSSQIPTYLVSQLARRHVTVSLSGDAGDELFGGYGRYRDAERRWQAMAATPRVLRAAAAAMLSRTPLWLCQLARMIPRVAHRWPEAGFLADGLRERASSFGAASLADYYLTEISFCQHPSELLRSAVEPKTIMRRSHEWPTTIDGLQQMMFVDACFYLPDDVLVKVDRAAMAVGLETRVPFLDTEVADLAWQIPIATHFRDGRGKWLLRQVLNRYVPQGLVDRPKTGFQVPVARWLRTDLKPWASSLLDAAKIDSQGIFYAPAIAQRWREHQAGEKDWSFHLWAILMFQAWKEAQT